MGQEIWGKSIVNIDPTATLSAAELSSYKFAQFMYQVGTFLIPSLIFALVLRRKIPEFFHLNPKLSKKGIGWTLLFFVLALFASSYMIDALSFVQWPDSIIEMEEQNQTLLLQLLKFDSLSDWMVNLLLFVLMPALVEEFFFRGVLLRMFLNSSRNAHLAVAISALIFALIHGQMTALLSFWLMGMVLGYLYLVSGDLKYPIILHMLHNGTSLILDALYKKGYIQTDPMNYELPSIIGLVALGGLIYAMYRFYQSIGSPHLKVNSANQIKWVKLWEESDFIKAQMLSDRLEAEGYQVAFLNKKDSNYGFGSAEIHVPDFEFESARSFLNKIK